MGEVLYRKYRSRSWPEVIGQDHIVATLTRAIDHKHIAHAYLFTGPRGVGKTSVARILAYAVNNIPYSDHATQLDIVEIDAASNRRIDEIRELREKVNVAPAIAKYKVYIIDEVHMLTKEAFNALLKTLEEPPAHVIFILATTEAHKLPMTIVSRTQRFMFRPIEVDDMAKHLRAIADKEKISISDEALRMIAKHSEGSLRDAISLLDQMRGYASTIEAAEVLSLLGDVPSENISSLLRAITDQDQTAAVRILTQMFEAGYEPIRIAKQLGERLREQILDSENGKNDASVALLKELVIVPASLDPKISLEISVIEATYNQDQTSNQPKRVMSQTPELSSDHRKIQSPRKTSSQPAGKEPKAETVAPKTLAPKTSKTSLQQSDDIDVVWPQVLEAIRTKYNTLYGILRMAAPEIAFNTLTLRFAFKFHKERMSEVKNREIISVIMKDITGRDVSIVCEISEELKKSQKEFTPELHVEQSDPKTIETITNIFGGGELLES
jgi:DNA polymerase III subunit gamma/tau